LRGHRPCSTGTGLVDPRANIGTVLVDPDWLSFEEPGRKIVSMGTRITSIDDLIGKAPLRDTARKGMGKTTLPLDRSVKKNALIFSRDFDASVSLNESVPLPLGVDLRFYTVKSAETMRPGSKGPT
jgi:hypothetical protein